MERKDILSAKSRVPGLGDVWEHKILQLEKDRERAWTDLRSIPLAEVDRIETEAESAYRKIHRLERSIAFLDRALLHICDIEHGTHYADDLPLRP